MDRNQRAYLLAGLACLLFVMTRYLTAGYYDNEEAYALNPLKIMDGSLFAGDFFLDRLYPFFLVFDLLVIPLYFLLGALAANIVLRVAIWIFQIWALGRLMRTLGMRWWGFIVLFVLWLNVEQTLAAGDWIIGCASQKPLSYGFVFLALDALLRDRRRTCAVFCGVATAFHIIAGFWTTLAIVLVMLVFQREKVNLRGLIEFGVVTSLCALPGVAPAVWGEFFTPHAETAVAAAANATEMQVRFLHPYHLDPAHFLSGGEALKAVVFFGLALLFLWKTLPEGKRGPVVGFVAATGLFFVSGLLGRRLELWGYLQYYPFRIADSFVPLLFWTGVVLLFQRAMDRSRRLGIVILLLIPLQIGVVRYVIDQAEPEPTYDLKLGSFATAVSRTEPRLTAYWIRERALEWFSPGSPSDYEQVTTWIRGNTPRDSRFLTPPYASSFAVSARRPQYISMQIPKSKLLDGMERLARINRGPFQNVGFDIWNEMRENYPRLTVEEVAAIGEEHEIEFFLTDSEQDYGFEVVYENSTYRLYRF